MSMWQGMVPILMCAFVAGVGLAWLLLPPMEDIHPPFLDETTTVERAELDCHRRRLALWTGDALIKVYRIAASSDGAWPQTDTLLSLWRVPETEGTGFLARDTVHPGEHSLTLRFMGVPRRLAWRLWYSPMASLPRSAIALHEAEVRELQRVIADGTPLLVAGLPISR